MVLSIHYTICVYPSPQKKTTLKIKQMFSCYFPLLLYFLEITIIINLVLIFSVLFLYMFAFFTKISYMGMDSAQLPLVE